MEQLTVRPVRGLAAVALIASSLVVASTDSASAIPGQRRWAQRYDYDAGTDFVTDMAGSPGGSAGFVAGGLVATAGKHGNPPTPLPAGGRTPGGGGRHPRPR